MDMMEAIEQRISCRAYEEAPIDQAALDALTEEAQKLSAEGDVRIVLHVPAQDGSNLALSPKMFAGAPFAYLTLAAPDDELSRERIGYFGEKIVLLATTLGLGTCWVAGTYDRDATVFELQEDDVLHDVVPVGVPMRTMPLKQRTIRTGIRAKSKKRAKLYDGPVALEQAPEWIGRAIDAVWKAPSAVNEQPVVFVQETEDAPVRATLPKVRRGLEYTDLGIAKLHFELAASACGVTGTWDWGAGAAFAVGA